MRTGRDIAIIRVPLWYGCNKRGVEQAPRMLSDILTESPYKSAIKETADIAVVDVEENETRFPNAKHLSTITAVNRALSAEVAKQLAQGRFVLTLGGDHSLGLGTVSGTLEEDENAGLIWFDAHGDMNTETSSPTGNVHGMPVAALMGLCSSELNNVPARHIKPENVFWVGARDLDKGEQALAERMHLHIYSTDDIHNRGMEAVMQEIRETMEKQGIKHIHLSFDVDAFDPKWFPATGVKVPKGLWKDDFDAFTRLLPSMPELAAIDVVEYNPTMDNEKKGCLNKMRYFIEHLLSIRLDCQ